MLLRHLQKSKNKKLKISIFQNGSYGVLNVQNYCSSSVLQTNPTLYTSKEDKKITAEEFIVKSIAKKYGGDVVISDKNNEFTVTVILR